MNYKIDFTKDRYCPVYKREIYEELCYDSMMCLGGYFKISSTEELAEVENIEEARKICDKCLYNQ